MPTYNRASVLGSAIGGVLSQTCGDFEFLIYDDGSTDGSPDVARTFDDSRIKLLDTRRCGPPKPLNEIYAKALGEFVIILHDHDIFNPTLLEASLAVLNRNPSAAFALQ